MKKIYKIARTELQTLFYSPVAWLVLLIFAFQAAMVFTNVFQGFVQTKLLGYNPPSCTASLFISAWGGLFPAVQKYLYLYIPLLTMGLMSRELSSGSIKLLYSSPVTNTQIILGKFLSMMIYGLAMMGVLFIFVLFAACTIKDLDIPAVMTGMLGLYLLLCTYAAIGLFMSSLTSYQVVAAILTLAMLGALSYVQGMWQDIELVREVTYWLGISGRANEFITGLLCSEDILYFIIVTALFLFLSVIRLQSSRQKAPWSTTLGKYLAVLLVTCLLGYLTSRPALMTYYDATVTKSNTLTPNSQEVISKLKGGLTITTYVNVLDEDELWTALPRSVKRDQERFRQYVRFKPEIEMKYVYYYDTINDPRQDQRYPDKNTKERAWEIIRIYGLDTNMFLSPEQIRAQVDLSPEKNRFVRLLERESGEKTFLRVYNDPEHHPTEREITAAFKRIAMDLPKVGFLTGHGERDITRIGDRDYNFAWDKPFRYALINQGFDVEEVNLDKEIPEDINILVIGEIRNELPEIHQVNLDKYIARGGNLWLSTEPRRREIMEPFLSKLGVGMVPGQLVRPSKNYTPNLIRAHSTPEAREWMYDFESLQPGWYTVTMPSVAGLEYTEDKGYKVTPLLLTDTLVWNELETTDFVDDTIRLNPQIGEVEKVYATSLALTRQVGDKEQKIMIFGDADCVSNGEVSMPRKGIYARNFQVILGSFYWLSDEEVPIDVRRPGTTDNDVYLGQVGMSFWGIFLKWILPGLLAVISIVLWMRRRGR